MRFTKMQALGNDYVCLDLTRQQPEEELSRLARTLTDRHFGVGGDGLLCVLHGKDGRLRMALYNADGSRAAMCGNGIRCLAAYAWSHGLAEEGSPLTVETDAGLRILTASADGIRVEMGRPVLGESLVLEAGGRTWRVRPVSMGNPHAVIFVPRLDRAPLEQVGPELERHSAFPDRTNVELVEVATPDLLRMRVWERGCGETLACGTGACAAFAAAAVSGLTARRGRVELPGGVLSLDWPDPEGSIFLEGPAFTVFEGEWPGGS
ncbi:diaminopimelate epimerase [uncultured Intestinimonas sp.]|uniref:diaminopimelate epimerase n=1 Tax=uncultured Intestinimonas sp. TaxID=1689265 RepID=UPI0025FE4908|nr:diaminopimelate epimerase [uncultured Intestinimonas sp.]